MRLEEKVSDLTLRLKIAQSDKERYMQVSIVPDSNASFASSAHIY